ncbi:unnamed protein product [Amoebophrya sp. A25]|nr:unnamed protein product [Amoebophrya sp. A25]|eukprot:GSA25T00021688001.1
MIKERAILSTKKTSKPWQLLIYSRELQPEEICACIYKMSSSHSLGCGKTQRVHGVHSATDCDRIFSGPVPRWRTAPRKQGSQVLRVVGFPKISSAFPEQLLSQRRGIGCSSAGA